MVALDSIAANVLSGLVTGVVTAGVSVRLALRRFRAERAWERKIQAYSEIFDALFHLKAHAQVELQRHEERAQFDVKYLKELGDRATAGYSAIRKAAVMGTFMLSREAAEQLRKVEEMFDDPHNRDIVEQLTAELKIVESAIENLRLIAKRDLQLE